jgi:hypothetical protein
MRGPNRPYMCARFTLSEDRAFSLRWWSVRIRSELILCNGGLSKTNDGAAKTGQPAAPLRRIAAPGSWH